MAFSKEKRAQFYQDGHGGGIPKDKPSTAVALPSRPFGGLVTPIGPEKEAGPYQGTAVAPVEGGYSVDLPNQFSDIYVPSISGTAPSTALDALVEQYKGLSEEGLGSREMDILRSQAAAASSGAYQTAMRQAAQQQAAQNIRGGAAASQQARLAQQYAVERARQEQDLMLKDVEYKEGMRQKYAQGLGSQLGIESADINRLLGAQGLSLGAESFQLMTEADQQALESYLNMIENQTQDEGSS